LKLPINYKLIRKKLVEAIRGESKDREVTEESSFIDIKDEFEKVKDKFIEIMPEMENKANELKFNINSINEEIEGLTRKREPFQKELDEIERTVFEARLPISIFLRYEEIKYKIKAIISKFFREEEYNAYIKDDFVIISIKSIGNELKLNIINEMVNDLITALNITESEFVISTSKQLDEILFVFPLGVLQVESQKQL
jgi:hypothetical protein